MSKTVLVVLMVLSFMGGFYGSELIGVGEWHLAHEDASRAIAGRARMSERVIGLCGGCHAGEVGGVSLDTTVLIGVANSTPTYERSFEVFERSQLLLNVLSKHCVALAPLDDSFRMRIVPAIDPNSKVH